MRAAVLVLVLLPLIAARAEEAAASFTPSWTGTYWLGVGGDSDGAPFAGQGIALWDAFLSVGGSFGRDVTETLSLHGFASYDVWLERERQAFAVGPGLRIDVWRGYLYGGVGLAAAGSWKDVPRSVGVVPHLRGMIPVIGRVGPYLELRSYRFFDGASAQRGSVGIAGAFW